LDEEAIDAVTAREWRTLRESELSYRGERSRPRVQGCTVILVDDGLTTGASMRAAVQALNEEPPEATGRGSPGRIARDLRSDTGRGGRDRVCADAAGISTESLDGTKSSYRPRMRRSTSCSTGRFVGHGRR